MIRVNLLPHKKKKSRSAPVEGEKSVAIGGGILMALAAVVFLFVHSPLSDEIESTNGRTDVLRAENSKIKKRTADFDKLKAAFAAAQKQALAIEELNNARSTPANFLFELATILKPDGKPTISTAMDKQIEKNENLRWQEDWDPTHVWMESFAESGGEFTIKGSAQNDGDVTQFAHRLAASAYFDNVQPEGAKKNGKSNSGIVTYQFTITGRVRY